MTPSPIIPDGYELLAGRNRANAVEALATAEERGLEPQSVLTVRDGYLIPLGDDAEQEGGEELLEGEVHEIEFPKETDSHEQIDEWAANFDADLGGPISYEGIEAEKADKPTKAEKIAHLRKVVDERAAANDETQGGN